MPLGGRNRHLLTMARALQDIPLAPRHNVVRPSALLTMPGMAATAAVALGLAVSVNYGQFHPQAVAWLAAAARLNRMACSPPTPCVVSLTSVGSVSEKLLGFP